MFSAITPVINVDICTPHMQCFIVDNMPDPIPRDKRVMEWGDENHLPSLVVVAYAEGDPIHCALRSQCVSLFGFYSDEQWGYRLPLPSEIKGLVLDDCVARKLRDMISGPCRYMYAEFREKTRHEALTKAMSYIARQKGVIEKITKEFTEIDAHYQKHVKRRQEIIAEWFGPRVPQAPSED